MSPLLVIELIWTRLWLSPLADRMRACMQRQAARVCAQALTFGDNRCGCLWLKVVTRPWSGRSACVWGLRPRVNFFNVDHVVRRRDACQALLLPCPVFLLASRSTLPTLRTLLTVSVPRTGVLGMETVAHRATRQPARQPAEWRNEAPRGKNCSTATGSTAGDQPF